jgi:hypothetical protein
MQKGNKNVLDILIESYNKSDGKTVDLVIDHEVLKWVTGQMFKWWNTNIHGKERYRMWCPEDHVDYYWEIPPTARTHVGSIHVADEKFGNYPPAKLRIRFDDSRSCPVERIYPDFGNGCILSPEDKPLVYVCHEFEQRPEGIKMRSTFRLPAKTPKKFIAALRQHNISEMGHLADFLPELYKKETAVN